MNEHERTLELAAAAIDFPLSPGEAASLTRHLATCPACTAAFERLRQDATAVAGTERHPAPAHVRQSVVRAAMGTGAPMGRGAGTRWSLVAVLLALLAVGGTFVTGAVLDRVRDTAPTATQGLAPRPTDGTPSRDTGWQDLGDVSATFEGRTVQTIIGGDELLAIGRDRRSTLPVVWTSRDGTSWNEAPQPADVFGGRVPTSGVSWDDRVWVVGWQIAVTGAQRAIWSSIEGGSWSRVDDPSALLGTEATDLRIVAGPAGLLVWEPDGRVWTSIDGRRWVRADIGPTGGTDAAVDERTFVVVGRDGDRAFVASSIDGVSWTDPATRATTADARVGIERAGSGTLLAWIGTRAFGVTRNGWLDRDDAFSVPAVADPQDIVGGDAAFAAFAPPTDQGVLGAWVGDGAHEWEELRSDPASRSRTIVGVVGGDGWYVLTRQGATYRGWRLAP